MRAPTSALLILTAATLLTGCSAIVGDTPQPTDNPSATTSGNQATTTSSTAEQVATWWTSGGRAHANQLSADLGKISNDSTDPTTVGNDCTTLSNDISAAQSYKPIPDDQAQHHWSAALDKYQQAATDCTAGVTTTDSGLITKAGTEITAGTAEIAAATARIKQLAPGGLG